jgi:integrative and conjugative element protein (TIGR02256 family)
LFGFVDGDDVVVGCAYGPGPHARHRRSSFESHRTTTEAIMAAVRRVSSQRYRFLGSWHTHPAGAAAPSYRDTQTAAEIAAEADVLLPSPLVIIQATRPRLRGAELAELAAWRWDPAINQMVCVALEPVELEERWCPAVAAPASDPLSLING